MYASPDNYIPQTGSLRRPLLMWLHRRRRFAGVHVAHHRRAAGSQRRPSFLGSHDLPGVQSTSAIRFPNVVFHRRTSSSQFARAAPVSTPALPLATIFYPLVRSLRQTEAPPRKWLFIAAAPLAIDFSLDVFRHLGEHAFFAFHHRRAARRGRRFLCHARLDGFESCANGDKSYDADQRQHQPSRQFSPASPQRPATTARPIAASDTPLSAVTCQRCPRRLDALPATNSTCKLRRSHRTTLTGHHTRKRVATSASIR